ncbi:methyltransferase domain-containing protein [Pedobacter sp. P351]|uniref:class I SAM-dependent methyltransferase n=1 Tax=Pedobacter superstes TaxID=3133441 RepID=UPI0030AFE985
MDVFGSALVDQFNNDAAEILWLHNSYDEPEEMPVDIFFRNESEMPDLELFALKQCKGKILDIGAGVGSHSLILQRKGFEVAALELSSLACSIMKQRGVKHIINNDIFSYQEEKFDTLLLLMNGIGIAGNMKKIPVFLEQCKKLLKEGGQIIFDSSDISYLYEGNNLPEENYFGEVSYQYEYKGVKGEWFDWVYIDKNLLTSIAKQFGFICEIIFEDGHDQYLAKFTPQIKYDFL